MPLCRMGKGQTIMTVLITNLLPIKHIYFIPYFYIPVEQFICPSCPVFYFHPNCYLTIYEGEPRRNGKVVAM